MNEADESPLFTLESGVERHRLEPASFEIPPQWHRENLRVGEWARLLFQIPRGGETLVERMWVQVVHVLPEHYVGFLDNDSTYCAELRCGHRVEFHAGHIIDISPPRMYLDDEFNPDEPGIV